MVKEFFENKLEPFLQGLSVNSIISDSFTVIAGFIAIGIPLAVQFANKATEKFENPLLAKQYTTGSVASPVTLMLLSFLYIVLALFYKLVFDIQEEQVTHPLKLHLALALIVIFSIIVLLSLSFYVRLFSRATQKSSIYIGKLLKFPLMLKLDYVSTLNGEEFHSLNLFKSIALWRLRRFQSSKYKRRHYSTFESGLEVLLDARVNRPWDIELQLISENLSTKFRKAYFGYYSHLYNVECNKKDLKFIKAYWDFNVRLAKRSCETGDTALAIGSQRELCDLLSFIVNSPQYDFFLEDGFQKTLSEKISWKRDIFDLIRLQSRQSLLGINFILECEWIKEISSSLIKKDIRYSSSAINDAINLYEQVFCYVAKNSPEHLLDTYVNLVSQTYYFSYPNMENLGREYHWVNFFFLDFYKKSPMLCHATQWLDELERLKKPETILAYGNRERSKPLPTDVFDRIKLNVDYKRMYESSYMKTIQYSGLKCLAYMALFERWNQLESCLYWRQPKEANANWAGENVLPESIGELWDALLKYYETFNDNHFFYERKSLSSYIYDAAIYIMNVFIVNGDSVPDLSFGDSSMEKVEGVCLGLEKSLKRLSNIISEASLIENVLAKVFERNNQRKIGKAVFSKIAWSNYKSIIGRSWHEIIEGANTTFFDLLSIQKSKNVMPICENFLKIDSSPSLFTEEYEGRAYYLDKQKIRAIYTFLFRKIHFELSKKSYIIELDDLEPMKQETSSKYILFADRSFLEHHGFVNNLGLFGEYLISDQFPNVLGVKDNSECARLCDFTNFEITVTEFQSGGGTTPFIFVGEHDDSKFNIQFYSYFELVEKTAI